MYLGPDFKDLLRIISGNESWLWLRATGSEGKSEKY